MTTNEACPLCASPLPATLVRTDRWTVIDARDPDYPGLTRVVWKTHVAEMTDLSAKDRQDLLHVVLVIEQTMRDVLRPNKVNLASLGNQVPHLHWHIIPRWQDDRAYPASVWTERPDTQAAQARRHLTEGRLADYHRTLIQRLSETMA